MANSKERNNDDHSSFVVTLTPITCTTHEVAPPNFFFHTPSTSNSTQEDNDIDYDFMIDEPKMMMRNETFRLSSILSNYENDTPPMDQPQKNSRTIITPPPPPPPPVPKLSLPQQMSDNNNSWWYQRPPFHVTAMYLWTQFNVSYLFRKLSFLFDIHQHNDHSITTDVHYFPLMTIHYVESGIADIIIMNLIVVLFLSTSYVYKSPRPFSLLWTPTITVTNTTRSLQNRRSQNRSKSNLLELVTLVTFLLLILRLRGAAMNVILVSIIYMFLFLTHWSFQSSSSAAAATVPLPLPLLSTYKL